MLLTGLVLLFVSLTVLVFVATGALTGTDRAESEVLRQVAVYSVGPRGVDAVETGGPSRLGRDPLVRTAVGVMSQVARRGKVDLALDTRLEAAGFPLRPGEWMLLHVTVAVSSASLLALLTGGRPIAAVAGLILGVAGPCLLLTASRHRRESRFLAQLPDTLQLLAGGLAVGYSLPQAMDSVARESHPPIRTEFSRALVETRLGVPAEDTLERIAERTGNRDFAWVVMAIRIQREVGGNLAELLTTVAATLRERERLRRQVAALSAEGRLSGVILAALPVVFAVYLMLARPEYIDPLFSTPLGIGLLGLGLACLAGGGFWMSRVIRVDV